jgi:hypothetical protein
MRRPADSASPESARLDPKLLRQMRVSKLLGFGFALSVVWVGGLGSLAALFIGLRARKLIKDSGGELAGMRLAWWCIIAGACGVAILLPYTAWLVVKALRT